MHNLHEQPAVTFFWRLANTPEPSSQASVPALNLFYNAQPFVMLHCSQEHTQAGHTTLNQAFAPLLRSLERMMEIRN